MIIQLLYALRDMLSADPMGVWVWAPRPPVPQTLRDCMIKPPGLHAKRSNFSLHLSSARADYSLASVTAPQTLMSLSVVFGVFEIPSSGSRDPCVGFTFKSEHPLIIER